MTTCYSCDGDEYLDCSECGGSGELESDEYEVGYSKEYWVVSNPEVVTQFKMRDENAYIDTDTFEETTCQQKNKDVRDIILCSRWASLGGLVDSVRS